MTTRIFGALIVLLSVVIEIGYSCSPPLPVYRPIYLSFEDLRSAVEVRSNEPLRSPGKIVVQDSLLFVTDSGDGVHIIDNSDPANPTPLSFIYIPGNLDIAVKGATLYADSYVDLVTVDISTPASPSEVARLEDVYPNEPFLSEDFNGYVENIDESQGVVVDAEYLYTPEGGCGSYGSSSSGFFGCSSGGGGGSAYSGNGGGTPTTGVSGSLARIIALGDYLYLLAGYSLKSISTSDPFNPQLAGSMVVGWDIETIYPYQNTLFIGGQTGVYILDLSNPAFPTQLAKYEHDWQCDPVVVEDGIAYITLRNGARCWGGENRLDVVDMSALNNPSLISSYPMENPHGLAIDTGLLFVADGTVGLKVFDASDPASLVQTNQFPLAVVHDVVLLGGQAVVIGEGGIYQYDYSDSANITLVSELLVSGAQ
ncbi:MAG: hypothetical protein GY807_16730 [Gammaproteobacteria bacterium]|nr:hypothetical protein [Gammaproteobacteria bacterium]